MGQGQDEHESSEGGSDPVCERPQGQDLEDFQPLPQPSRCTLVREPT